MQPRKIFPRLPDSRLHGREWKRKGLYKIISIWREFETIPQIKLCLAGFDLSEKIGLKPEEEEFVTILGVVSNKANFYEQIDLLLHPAQREAFGMVIAEALSLGIPVVCSSECGAASVNPFKDYVLNYDSPLGHWVKATRLALFGSREKPSSNHGLWLPRITLPCINASTSQDGHEEVVGRSALHEHIGQAAVSCFG